MDTHQHSPAGDPQIGGSSWRRRDLYSNMKIMARHPSTPAVRSNLVVPKVIQGPFQREHRDLHSLKGAQRVRGKVNCSVSNVREASSLGSRHFFNV